MALHALHMAVSHPSPSSFRRERVRVTDGAMPLTFLWNRSAVYALMPVTRSIHADTICRSTPPRFWYTRAAIAI
jgi:hypothetical protein